MTDFKLPRKQIEINNFQYFEKQNFFDHIKKEDEHCSFTSEEAEMRAW